MSSEIERLKLCIRELQAVQDQYIWRAAEAERKYNDLLAEILKVGGLESSAKKVLEDLALNIKWKQGLWRERDRAWEALQKYAESDNWILNNDRWQWKQDGDPTEIAQAALKESEAE